MAWTVDSLLSDAKLRANFPSSNGAITDAELLQLGNDELLGIMAGRLMAPMAGYYAYETTEDIVPGQSNYDIPSRAIGAKLNYGALIDGSGNRYDLSIQSAGMYGQISRLPAANVGGAFLQGMQLVLVPVPNTGDFSLIMGYFMRPNKMVLASACGVVSSVTSTQVTLVSTKPSTFVTGVKVDFLQANPHFRTLGFDATLTAASGSTLTFASGVIPSDIRAGDYVALASEAPVVQLPVEVQPLLAARWAMRILRQRGAIEQAQAMVQDIADLESTLYTFLVNRAESQPETMGPPQLISRRVGLYGFSGFSY